MGWVKEGVASAAIDGDVGDGSEVGDGSAVGEASPRVKVDIDFSAINTFIEFSEREETQAEMPEIPEASSAWERLEGALRVALVALAWGDVTALQVAHELCRGAPGEAREAVAATFSRFDGVDFILMAMMGTMKVRTFVECRSQDAFECRTAAEQQQQEFVTKGGEVVVMVLGLGMEDRARQQDIRYMYSAYICMYVCIYIYIIIYIYI